MLFAVVSTALILKSSPNKKVEPLAVTGNNSLEESKKAQEATSIPAPKAVKIDPNAESSPAPKITPIVSNISSSTKFYQSLTYKLLTLVIFILGSGLLFNFYRLKKGKS